MTITDEELARIEALCDAATPGPWIECVETSRDGLFQFSGIVSDAAREHIAGSVNTAGDSAFIAESRAAVPALVAEVRRLRAELAEAQAAIKAAMEEKP